MGFRSRFGAAWRGLKGQTLDQLPGFMFQRESKTGISVSWATALEVSTVLACVSRLADGVATPPLKVMKPLDKGGAKPWLDHQLYKLLYRRPNSWQTSFEFRQTLTFHRALCGNAFVYISRVGGRIHELIPLEPQRVTVRRQPDLSLIYLVTGDDGRQRPFTARDIWHLRGPSWNSWMGLESVKLAREAIGLALATEETHALFHRNGAQTTGVVSVEGTLGDDGHKELSEWIEQQVTGSNRHKYLLLDRAAKFLQTQMTGVDAQHLETRRHQIEEICRHFNVRPIMVMHSVKEATFASSEQMFLAHVTHTMNPWWEEFQQSAENNLLDDTDIAIIRFNPGVLLRGSMQAEADYFYKAGGGRPWMTANDIRGLKDMPSIDGGDELPPAPTAGAASSETPADPPPKPEDSNDE